MLVALGFRAHSGWAAMVAVAGAPDTPRILDRRRIVIANPDLPGSKQPYHAAEGLPFAAAERLIQEAVESSRALAVEAISAVQKKLRAEGHKLAGCAVLTGSGKPLPELAKILSAHPLIHTAEGVMFREVLLWAAKESGLGVLAVPEKTLDAESLERIGSLGKLIGPPWTQDQKYAAVAAFRLLAQTPMVF